MISVLRASAFSQNLTVYDGMSQLASIEFSLLSYRAEIWIGGTVYDGQLSGPAKQHYTLYREHVPVVSAFAASGRGRRWNISTGDAQFTLRGVGFIRTRFELTNAAQRLGSIYKDGFWSHDVVVDLSPDLPPVLTVFLIWMVAVRWRRHVEGSIAAAV